MNQGSVICLPLLCEAISLRSPSSSLRPSLCPLPLVCLLPPLFLHSFFSFLRFGPGIFLQELARPHVPPFHRFQVMEAMVSDEHILLGSPASDGPRSSPKG
ncbi:uncharacterized protein [Physcomitrium patens]|uniref:uncharacterized protein n=1 Tax=Physcomitrium patens TaxID=3218 RepID=UPI003CCE1753